MFINIKDHPSKKNVQVFHYQSPEHANHFESMLNENQIPFEKQQDVEGDQQIYFGIAKPYFEQAKKLNFLTLGHFRKPFIPDPFFKYFLLIISAIVLGLAIAGAIVSQ